MQTNCYCYPSSFVSVNISTTTPNAQIRWTNDGTDPTPGNPSTHVITSSSGPAYGNSYDSVTFRAVAFRGDMLDSDEDYETFYYDSGNRANLAQSMAAPVSNGAAYDANGNLQSYKGWTYTYDAQNRLTVADNNAGTHVRYYYDGLNRRIASSDINGNVTINVWDGWNLAEERTSANGLIALYIAGAATDEKVLRWSPNTGRFWYHQDGRGNVSHLSHDSGIMLERYTYDLAGNARVYDPSGNIRASGSAYSNRFLFQGRDYSSDLGLYDYRNRIYFPQWGRFLQPDPIRFRGDRANMYRYCGNDSVNYTDPSGLIAEHTFTFKLRNKDGPEGASGGYPRDVPAGPSVGGNGLGIVGGGDVSSAPDSRGSTIVDNLRVDTGFDLTRSNIPGTAFHQFELNLNGSVTETTALFSDGIQDATGDWLAIASLINLPRDVLALIRGVFGLARSTGLTTVTHFTSAEGVAAITESGVLRANSYVTLPSEVAEFDAMGVERALELQPGRGAFSTTFQVPTSLLRIPANGARTSGGALQFQITEEVSVGTFVPTP